MPFRVICTICEAEVNDPAVHTAEACRDALKAALDIERTNSHLRNRVPWVVDGPYRIGNPPWEQDHK